MALVKIMFVANCQKKIRKIKSLQCLTQLLPSSAQAPAPTLFSVLENGRQTHFLADGSLNQNLAK